MKPEGGRRKRGRRLCVRCRQRPAKHKRPNGRISRDAEHDLCPKCNRSLVDASHARRLAGR